MGRVVALDFFFLGKKKGFFFPDGIALPMNTLIQIRPKQQYRTKDFNLFLKTL